jgi:hypothetical protein
MGLDAEEGNALGTTGVPDTESQCWASGQVEGSLRVAALGTEKDQACVCRTPARQQEVHGGEKDQKCLQGRCSSSGGVKGLGASAGR